MSSFSRWLAATSGVLAVAAVTWGRRWLPPRSDVEVTSPPGERFPALVDIRERLLAPQADARLGALRDWVEFGGRAVENRQPALNVLCEALRELPWPGDGEVAGDGVAVGVGDRITQDERRPPIAKRRLGAALQVGTVAVW